MDFLSEIQNDTNKTLTENGAIARATTNSFVLDFFSMAGSMRNNSEDEIIKLFSQAYSEDPIISLKCLCYLRDIRGGQGERRIFRICFKWLFDNLKISKYNLNLLIQGISCLYGRWDDLFFDKKLITSDIIYYVYEQLKLDIKNDQNNETISLLAKWLPSENTSSEKTKDLAKLIRHMFSMDSRTYRQTLSKLRKRIKLIEHNLSNKDYDSINYETVPSQAMMKYRKVFNKHDSEKYSKYLQDVTEGKKDIKAGTLFPYQIVAKCLYDNLFLDEKKYLDTAWTHLPNYSEKIENALCICDVSRSMNKKISNNVTCMSIAISLAIYIAEHNTGVFKNHFITFSDKPSLEKIIGSNIYDKCNNLRNAHWNRSTNIEKVFDLILKTAINNNLTQEQIPSKLYIVSDMEFNTATQIESDDILFETIRKRFEEKGYQIPKLVFWRVNTRSKQFPVSKNEKYTQLISGFNPSVLQYLIGNEFPDAYQNMVNILTSDRYNLEFK